MRAVVLMILLGLLGVGSHEFYHKYNLLERYAAGKFGEVWRAVENKIGAEKSFIIKRIFTEKGYHAYLSGLREIHFGNRLKGAKHVSKFVESHEDDGNLWLVFEDGGTSLHKLLYTLDKDQRLNPSALQAYLTSVQGQNLTKEIMKQILEGVHETHQLDITHRDLKPENVVVNLFEDDMSMLEDALHCMEAQLIDYGSAVDEESAQYYPEGPSQKEETAEYSPPESIFDEIPYSERSPQSYDMWSVGVIFLEMLLGTSKVFQADPKSVAVISMLLQDSHDPKILQKAILFKALSNYCIYTPKNVAPFLFVNSTLMSAKCKNGTIHFPKDIKINHWGKSLLQWLLKWKPEERITAKKALSHAFFRGEGYKCGYCGKEFEFEEFLYYHLTTHHDPIPTTPGPSNDHTRLERGALLSSGVELDTVNAPVWRERAAKQLASGLELEKWDYSDIIPFQVFQEDRRQYLAPS